MKIIEGIIATPNAHIAIVISRFNHFINERLLNGAIDTFKRIGQIKDENITIIWVPGAYELPLAVNAIVNNKEHNAVIALGTIIRGDTMHFKFIADACCSTLSEIAIKYELPISFGILTTENIDQAIERAGTKAGNKGSETALTVLEMINVLKVIKNLKENL